MHELVSASELGELGGENSPTIALCSVGGTESLPAIIKVLISPEPGSGLSGSLLN